MITSISNSGGALAAVRLGGASKPKATVDPFLDTGSADGAGVRLGTSAKAKDDTPRAGFGDGTVSSPGAALRTIDRGVAAARKVVPSLEQIQQERLARNAEGQGQEVGKAQPVDLGFTQASANAVAGARDFVNSLGSSMSTVQARLAGREPQTGGSQASVAINGETVALYSRRTDQMGGALGSAAQPSLDVRA